MYLLHGSSTKPEWILTNDQMFNFVKNMSNSLSTNSPTTDLLQTESYKDIILNINIAGNADKKTTRQLELEGAKILTSIKKELNKQGKYKKL